MNLSVRKSSYMRAAGAGLLTLLAGACGGKTNGNSHDQPLRRSVDAATTCVAVADAEAPNNEGGASLTESPAHAADAAQLTSQPQPTAASQSTSQPLADAGGHPPPPQPVLVDASITEEVVPGTDAAFATSDAQSCAPGGCSRRDAGDASAQPSPQDAGVSPTDVEPTDAAVTSSADAGVCDPILTTSGRSATDGFSCFLHYGEPGSACHERMDYVFSHCLLVNLRGPDWSHRCGCDGATAGHITVWFSDSDPGFPWDAEACVRAAAECLAFMP